MATATVAQAPASVNKLERHWVYSAGERKCAVCGHIIPTRESHQAEGRVPNMVHYCEEHSDE